ncbi:MAG: hypothetical protein KAR11_06160 [Phycisphaerae bacterium]|nr:hypothetical protein [Phycisphaerae bacterium]
MAKKEWNKALRYANRAKTYVRDRSQKAQLRRVYGKLDAEGQKLLKKSREAFNSKAYLEAITGYEDICCTFGHLPCAIAARDALKHIESIPEAQSVLQDRKAYKLAEKIERTINGNQSQVDDQCATENADEDKDKNEEARDGESSSNDTEEDIPATDTQPSRVEQIKLLCVVKQAKVIKLMAKAVKLYPLSQAGKQAGDDLEVLQKDEAFQAKLKKYIQTQEAKRLYKLAEMYRKANLIPKALKYYKQVVENFPGTDLADKAKKRVAALEK